MKFTQIFLKAKHWHLFMLLFGIPMIFYFVMMIGILTNIGSSSEPDLLVIYNFFKFFPLIIILIMGVFFGWLWSVAIGLQYKIPAEVKMKITRFKIFFFIPLVYILLISVGLTFMLINLSEFDNMPGLAVGAAGAVMAIILPVHLFSIFCMFHSYYFLAKTLKTVELQRETSFSDFAGEFFMIWFYPIGIWIIQPKINKIVETSNDDLKLMSELR